MFIDAVCREAIFSFNFYFQSAGIEVNPDRLEMLVSDAGISNGRFESGSARVYLHRLWIIFSSNVDSLTVSIHKICSENIKSSIENMGTEKFA